MVTRAAIASLALLATPSASEPPGDPIEIATLLYDFEVAAYCGLVTDRVGDAFRDKLRALVERHAVTREEMDALRGRAWAQAHAEWQNRGLGGFRGWCRGDARRAAERVLGRDE